MGPSRNRSSLILVIYLAASLQPSSDLVDGFYDGLHNTLCPVEDPPARTLCGCPIAGGRRCRLAATCLDPTKAHGQWGQVIQTSRTEIESFSASGIENSWTLYILPRHYHWVRCGAALWKE